MTLIWGRSWVIRYVAQASRTWPSTSSRSFIEALSFFASRKTRTDALLDPALWRQCQLVALELQTMAVFRWWLEIASRQRYIWRAIAAKSFWMSILRWTGFGPLSKDAASIGPKLETWGLMGMNANMKGCTVGDEHTATVKFNQIHGRKWYYLFDFISRGKIGRSFRNWCVVLAAQMHNREMAKYARSQKELIA